MKSKLFARSVTINTAVPESFQLRVLKARLDSAIPNEIRDKLYFYLPTGFEV